MTGSNGPAGYAPERFINRAPELKHIQEKIEDLLANRLVEGRTIIFTGEHGMGKSWLLRHVEWIWSQHGKLKTCRIDLAHFAQQLPPLEVLLAIDRQLARQLLGKDDLPNAGSEAQLRFLLGELKQRILESTPLLLLLDSVYESSHPLLGVLEEHLLAPLAVERRVLLVLAGRGVEYPWRQPELRMRAEFGKLEPFDEEATAAQLQLHLPAAQAQAIHDLTKGNPKASWLLASHPDLGLALNQMFDEMLAPIPEQEKRAKVRLYMEAVAVPRIFDDTTIPILWAAHQDVLAFREMARREVREIRELLLAPGLVYWDGERGGYTLHPSTRNLLLQFLCAVERERWRRLHQVMVELYDSWTKEYPKSGQRWQEEAAFLHQQLASRCP